MSQEKQIVQELGPIFHAVAGGVGGMIALTFTYPLDIIKTRMQNQHKKEKQDELQEINMIYHGTMDAIMQITKKEGMAGLYRGLGIGLLTTLVNQFVYFYFYETLKPIYYRGKNQTSTALQLILGIHSASLNCIVTTPLNVVVTHIQTSLANDGVVETCQKIFHKGGLSAFWKGLRPSLILTINPAITHLCYERLRGFLLQKKKTLSAYDIFIIAAISKTIATVITYPYIMAKVRLQANSHKPKAFNNKLNYSIVKDDGQVNSTKRSNSNHSDQKNEKHSEETGIVYSGSLDVFRHVLATEGFFGIYKGMQAQILKGVLTQAILFMMKEEIMILTLYIFSLFYPKKLKVKK